MRNRINFWLDDSSKDEARVLKTVKSLRAKRLFTQTVKDGIMIMNQLRQKKTDLLFKLHPWIIDKVLASAPPPKEVIEMQKQIADLRKLIIEQGTIQAPPADYPQMKSLSAGIGSTLGVNKKLTLPTFDDDDMDTVVITKAAGGNGDAAWAAMMKIAF